MPISEVADGIVAWIDDSPRFGSPNSAAVVEPDGITVVDTGTVPSLIAPFAAELALLEIPIRRVVYTSSHIEYVGGSTMFRLAAVYGSPEINAHLEQPPNTAGYQNLLPEHHHELAELTTRKVTHVVREAAWISERAVVVPVSGQIRENLVVQVPDAGVVLAGAMGSFGVTPAGFGGDPGAWIDGLGELLDWGSVIVPGHGPAGGEPEVRAQQDYLRACVAAAGRADDLADGPWSGWASTELTPANVERAALLAAGDDSPPPAILTLMGLA
jgi:glyoxylase-like metal-dependent hydrolase (beta-lactamase superfamily II)